MLLTACSSELTPNIENFSRAINTELHKDEICFADPDFIFPRTVLSGNKSGEKLIAKLDALHAAKLISRVKSKKKADDGKEIAIKYVNAFSYELTGSGYKFSRKVGKKGKKALLKFCFAKAHAASIEKFSKPEKTSQQMVSNVTFKYSITKVASWAREKKLLDQFPDVQKSIDTLQTPLTKQATVILTKKRWVYKK